jgi:hypothetical protein
MLNIPPELLTRYVAFLEKRAVPSSHYNDYQKWLRYYLDYCAKYGSPVGGSKRLTQFLTKLREKKQTEVQIRQAGHAVTLYHDLQRDLKPVPSTHVAAKSGALVNGNTGVSSLNSTSYINGVASSGNKSPWDLALSELTSTIKTRHYSPKTLKYYRHWVSKFKGYRINVAPMDLSA